MHPSETRKDGLSIQIRQFPPLIPVANWQREVGDRSTASIRWDIFTNRNGFNDRCVIRRGRRLLINVQAYFEWLNEQQGAA